MLAVCHLTSGNKQKCNHRLTSLSTPYIIKVDLSSWNSKHQTPREKKNYGWLNLAFPFLPKKQSSVSKPTTKEKHLDDISLKAASVLLSFPLKGVETW